MCLDNLEIDELKSLCDKIRKKIIDVVLKNGGHLASNLGVVELTVALKKVFNEKNTKFLFDVGHQSYVYKILTDREDRFDTLRTLGGVGPFTDPKESPYDYFISGHAGNALSAGVGLAIGNPEDKVIVMIGDASIGNGHSLEALNNMVDVKNIIVVLNDNEMSIGENVGGLSKFFSKLISSNTYMSIRKDVKRLIGKGNFGKKVSTTIKRAENSIKNFFLPASIAENLGFKYFGVIDGHNLKELISIFEKAKKIEGPVFIHVKTKKGKGYKPAEDEQEKFHGIGPSSCKKSNGKIYSDVIGEKLTELGEKDGDIIGISAGMIKGTGLKKFFDTYPERAFDIGITEGHGITFAGGLVKAGKKPYFAVYSTFLQRGFGQLIHDISLQNLPVRLLIDRAGIVGEDGKTHNGLYDISMFTTISNFILVAPTTEKELREVLDYSVNTSCPMAIRYPKEEVFNIENDREFQIGKWKEIKKGKKNLFVCTGSMLKEILNIEDLLLERGIEGTIVSAASIIPMDTQYIETEFKNYENIFVLEEAYAINGFGSSIINYLNDNNIMKRVIKISIDTGEIPHGRRDELLEIYGLRGKKLVERIEGKLNDRRQ
ncbi:1-deoxy-D-xylulose-5-phosphate synthase [Fusobacterium perfoetens]|uniref:1-deoxy-D-xylulose-5-phosphate synthase n=1 Tax=Fusobacterium perfoetens TaxID=852 RepID=UPI00056D3FC3|nr:1-deoxy-D-xylulose-5-phosphate synthase [Fusobacterium perfoetens]MCI6152995.1 1-deoxy-D-xylulose-5-phosphate synthase [Fusobacterium perfoetens]MDY3237392.1 1-deoxy-D-xylulose-5-phosphate synthase [Fusobacterium perfoetens]